MLSVNIQHTLALVEKKPVLPTNSETIKKIIFLNLSIKEGKEHEPGTGTGPPGTGSGPRGTGYGGYSGYYTDPLKNFNRNDEFWSRREKAS